MTRDEKIAKARELRAKGWSYNAIDPVIGTAGSGVAYKLLNPRRAKGYHLRSESRPDRKRAKRQWEREHRAACSRCGRPRGQGTGTENPRHGLCADCWHADQREQGDATGRRLEEMWLAGMTYAEIQSEMGWAKGTVSSLLDRYRERGYDLPYRRTGVALDNIREGARRRERVAA